MSIKTGSWFARYPADHLIVGISRGTPRNLAPGHRMYPKLQPGPWFNSVSVEEYRRRYQAEVLDKLDPKAVAAELAALAGGRVPVLCCFERPHTGQWCHRALAAAWLAEALGEPVPEFGFEGLAQAEHPLRPPADSATPPAPQGRLALE